MSERVPVRIDVSPWLEGVLKKGDVYPVHMLKSDVNAAWLSRFHPQTRVSRGGRENVKKGALAPVKVESDRR